MAGPLSGVRIVELAGIGPGPFCGMILSDLGAEVIRIDRVGAKHEPWNIAGRGRRSIAVDLKSAAAADVILALVKEADGLIEDYRPGVTERLGLGPDECLAVNPRLAYGRMTGWGQYGPLAHTAGHDVDYIAVSGVLYGMGDPDRPPRPPLNLVGDYGGGAMFLAVGMLSAIMHACQTGQGQVVDAAMTDGSALLGAMCYGRLATGGWSDGRGENVLDGSAPFYGVYQCADGEYMAFGAVESQFTDELLRRLGLDAPEVRDRWYDPDAWPELRERVAAIVGTKTRSEWTDIFEGTDACAVPVQSLTEATRHPHNVARGTFRDVDGIVQPGPAPRFSETPGDIRGGNPAPGENSIDVLTEAGYAAADIEILHEKGVIGT